MYKFSGLLALLHFIAAGASGSEIIGGKEALPHSRPYMASLQHNSHHVCGGFLIDREFVLTSAHCYQYKPSEVVLGAHNIKIKEKMQQRIQTAKYHVHPLYKDPKMTKYDVMLLQLGKKATLNKYVRVIELPKESTNNRANRKCSAAGWGRTKPNSGPESVLHEVNMTTEFPIECENMWKNHFSSQQMICMRPSIKRGICQGDSGGPLVCNKAVGIAAFTLEKCDSPKYPNVFMKTSFFVPWIKEVIKEQRGILTGLL